MDNLERDILPSQNDSLNEMEQISPEEISSLSPLWEKLVLVEEGLGYRIC